jgi:hypothetical protein
VKKEDQPIGSRDDLSQISIEFLREVKDMTRGAEMEAWLNEKYNKESQLYRDLARLITAGVDEGWAANLEVDGPNFRRSRILEAAPETFQFSITAVYMNSSEAKTFKDEEDKDVLRGDYHGHPYGEINLVVPLDKGAQLKGLQGWLAGCRLDGAGSGKPALSGSSWRRGDRVVLSAGWSNFIRFSSSHLMLGQPAPGLTPS